MAEDLLILALGWLLGTLGPSITSAIARRRRLPEIKRALAIELNELRFDAVLSFGRHRGSLGAFDAHDMDLVRPILAGYRGGLHGATMDQLREILSRGDEAYIRIQNEISPGVTRYPVRYEAPYVTAHLGELTLLSPNLHRAVLQVLREIRLYNDKVEFVRQCHERTFDPSLSEKNAATNLSNLERAVGELGDRLRLLVTSVDQLVDPAGEFRAG